MPRTKRHLDKYPDLNDLDERMLFIDVTTNMVQELWGYAVPWFYFKWRRLYKEIKHRNEHVRWYNQQTWRQYNDQKA